MAIIFCQIRVQFDFSLIFRNFGGLGEAMLFYWTPMMLASLFVVYYGFRLWVYVRQFANSIVTNVLFLSAFFAYLTAFIILPTYDMDRFGCASRIVILLELVNFCSSLDHRLKLIFFSPSNLTYIVELKFGHVKRENRSLFELHFEHFTEFIKKYFKNRYLKASFNKSGY